MAEARGSIAFFATYRPPVSLDIFSCPIAPKSAGDEVHMTDGLSYNYNGQDIPPRALKAILTRPILKPLATDDDVDTGRVSGMVFVSERTNSLETLHIALLFHQGTNKPSVKIYNFADLYDDDHKLFKGVRLEDIGCFSGDHIVYVSTKDNPTAEANAQKRRQPWTSVFKTDLKTGDTTRLTPLGEADLSPSVSPSGKKIAVASFQYNKDGWNGEIEHLLTDIVVMDLEAPFHRTMVIQDCGWPTWGSDNVIFFHRCDEKKKWRVFRADISDPATPVISQVTPDDLAYAMTPAAIDETTVAVASIRAKVELRDVNHLTVRNNPTFYRHIEIYDSNGKKAPVKITETIKPLADHYNPFVIKSASGNYSIGYHRCNRALLETGRVAQRFDQVQSPLHAVGAMRVSGVFPTFSSDGKKLAFVDNDFRNIWLADSNGLRIVYTSRGIDSFFAPAWNQDPTKDTLYVCSGHAFQATTVVDIGVIYNVSLGQQTMRILTKGANNAFPSTSPDGKKLVYRSTRDWVKSEPGPPTKNLYIMENAEEGESGKITRLTYNKCVDTHCKWSPNGEWIVFSSNRDMKATAPADKGGLDSGYFAIYLLKVKRPSVVVRVMSSANDLAGHVCHPFFSPDGKSIVVASDLAGVSVDPISLPIFLHSVRPYGDIFSVDIDPDDIRKNKDLTNFCRITHTRFENSTPDWTDSQISAQDWTRIFSECKEEAPGSSTDEAESWNMTGHLCIGQRCC